MLFSRRSLHQLVPSCPSLVEAATISTPMVLLASTGSSLPVTAVSSYISVRRIQYLSLARIATKLTHVFSEFHLATKLNAQSCSFAGNATVQSSAPTDPATITSQLATCFSNPAVFTPSAPTTSPVAITSTSGSTTATQKNGGASNLISYGQAIAIAATGFVTALGAFVVL